ncbi:unnamed protein product [Rhodiola kirilowii]
MATAVSICFFVILLLGGISLYIFLEALSVENFRTPDPLNFSSTTTEDRCAPHPNVSSFNNQIIESQSVLFPEWIIFNIISSDGASQPADDCGGGDDGDGSSSAYKCVFQNNATSPAVYAGTFATSGRRSSFKCTMPSSVRRLRNLLTPALTKSELNASDLSLNWTSRPHLKRWNWLVYDSLYTADDVIVFAKNVNRPGHVRNSSTLRCVFTDVESSNHKLKIKTPVTSSDQEVFRCPHPNHHRLLLEGSRISLTLELLDEGRQTTLIPSVASYVNTFKTLPFQSSSSSSSPSTPSATLCACAMVNNVGKFLREWVMYHSAIGVEKFVLYDNDSDERLDDVVTELVESGYNVETVFWPWPKSQEAGFSHSVVSSKSACKWMIFVDVDEFVFSPKWTDSAKPSSDMLHTLLPKLNQTGLKQVGQVMIQCRDFGPSNQTSHPLTGVTQGYTCRKKFEERHKSIVLLAAVDESLQNSVHHFKIRSKVYTTEKVGVWKAVVNHYKYQAWSEFKTKFKRRVSTYVVDWSQNENLSSKDRTPGLGVEAVEPQGWATMFCEVVDTKLQLLTRKWFGRRMENNQSSVKMVWER